MSTPTLDSIFELYEKKIISERATPDVMLTYHKWSRIQYRKFKRKGYLMTFENFSSMILGPLYLQIQDQFMKWSEYGFHNDYRPTLYFHDGVLIEGDIQWANIIVTSKHDAIERGIIKAQESGNIPTDKKRVDQYDVQHNFIRTWPSVSKAEREAGIRKHGAISNVCNGKTKTAGGFVWKWHPEPEQLLLF